jgi:hypothetical protein
MSNETNWIDVDVKGEITDQHFFGRFEVKKYLTHKEKADSTRIAEMLCRGIEKNIEIYTFLSTLAFLNSHIKSTDASWWKKDEATGIAGMDMNDESPVWEISKKILELQKPKTETPAEQK